MRGVNELAVALGVVALTLWLTSLLAGCGGGSGGGNSCTQSGLTVSQLVDSQIPVTECRGDGCVPLTAADVRALDSNTQIFACGDVNGVCVGDGCAVGANNTGGPTNNDSFNPVDNSVPDNSTTTTETINNPA